MIKFRLMFSHLEKKKKKKKKKKKHRIGIIFSGIFQQEGSALGFMFSTFAVSQLSTLRLVDSP